MVGRRCRETVIETFCNFIILLILAYVLARASCVSKFSRMGRSNCEYELLEKLYFIKSESLQ